MKLIVTCIICSLILVSCRPYKNTPMKPNQITYQAFRAAQKSFSSSEGALKYIDKGKGDVIVLLHGVPTSGWLYRNIIDSLAQTHRVIVPDMLGFGNSASPKGYEIYSEERHGARLLELMNGLQIDSWTHVMHDAGGLWTWELIKQDPDRIDHLIILNTIIYEAGFAPPIRFEPNFMARTVMWSYRNGITTNMMLKGLFKSGLTQNDLNKTDVEGFKIPLREGKTRAMYYFFSQTCNALPDYSSIIKEINVPVCVIWGKNDSFLKWDPQRERVISHLNISEENIHLLDAKHFIQEEQPDKITKLILNFLAN